MLKHAAPANIHTEVAWSSLNNWDYSISLKCHYLSKKQCLKNRLKCTLTHIILPLSDQTGWMSGQTLSLAWHTVRQAYRKKLFAGLYSRLQQKDGPNNSIGVDAFTNTPTITITSILKSTTNKRNTYLQYYEIVEKIVKSSKENSNNIREFK